MPIDHVRFGSARSQTSFCRFGAVSFGVFQQPARQATRADVVPHPRVGVPAI